MDGEEVTVIGQRGEMILRSDMLAIKQKFDKIKRQIAPRILTLRATIGSLK